MSIRPHHRLSAVHSNDLTRAQKLRQRAQAWAAKTESRRQAWIEKRAARIERYKNAFRGSWISKIGLGLVALWKFVTDPPFIVKIEKRPVAPFVAMLPFGISFAKRDSDKRASTQSKIRGEALERRELLAADILSIDGNTPVDDAVTTSVFEPTITGDVDTAGSIVSIDLDGDSKSDVQVDPGTGNTTWTYTPTDRIDNGTTISVIENAVTTGTSFTADDSVTIAYEATINLIDGQNLQYAIDNLPPTGGTINLAAGTYPGDITINKSVIINGPNFGKAHDDGSRVAESVITGTVTVSANDVTLDGVHVDNSAAGFNSTAIIASSVEDLTIQNSLISNTGGGATGTTTMRRGINLDSVTNATIADNSIDIGMTNPDSSDLTAPFDPSNSDFGPEGFYGIQVAAVASTTNGVDITGNEIKGAIIGIRVRADNDIAGLTVGGDLTTDGNTITDVVVGIALPGNSKEEFAGFIGAIPVSTPPINGLISNPKIKHNTFGSGSQTIESAIVAYDGTNNGNAANNGEAPTITGLEIADNTFNGSPIVTVDLYSTDPANPDYSSRITGTNSVELGEGDDFFVGGTGTGADTVVLSGNYADYTIASVSNGVEITLTNGTQVDTLSNVEKLVFTGGTPATTDDIVVHIVGAGSTHTLATAVTAATAGDIVFVTEGTHTGDANIDKALTVLGPFAETAGTDNSRGGTVEAVLAGRIDVTANDVTIKGVTVGGSGLGFDSTAIFASGVSGLTIQNSIVLNTGTDADDTMRRGINLNNTTDATVTGNLINLGLTDPNFAIFTTTPYTGVAGTGPAAFYGIQVGATGTGAPDTTSNATISNNEISGAGIGVRVRADNDITGLTIDANTITDVVHGNTLPGNSPQEYGFADVDGTISSVAITNNTFGSTDKGLDAALFSFDGQNNAGTGDDAAPTINNLTLTGNTYNQEDAANADGDGSDNSAILFFDLFAGSLTPSSQVTGTNTITSGGGDDVIVGGTGADTISTGAGDDYIEGGAGNDDIDGGDDTDTAVFSGSRSAYALTTTADAAGFVTAITGVNGTDGTDTIANVEIFQFDDVSIDLTDPVQLFSSTGDLLASYETIQAAIDAAAATDVVQVKDGETVTLVSSNPGDPVTITRDLVLNGDLDVEDSNGASTNLVVPTGLTLSGSGTINGSVTLAGGSLSPGQQSRYLEYYGRSRFDKCVVN